LPPLHGAEKSLALASCGLGSRQIGISLLAYSPDRLAGAGTYTYGLTRALTSRAPGRYTVFVPRRYEDVWRGALPRAVNFVICGPDPDRRILRVLFEQTRLPKIALRHKVETIFFPHLFAPRWRRPRAVVTVYDLLLLSKQTDFPWYKRIYHRLAYQSIAARAAHVVTISEFCRRDIVQRLGLLAERVVVAPPGLDAEFLEPLAGGARRLALPERYLLSVAGRYPHKRLSIVLDAFALLSDEVPGLHLVVAGTYAGDRVSIADLFAAAKRRGVAARVQVMPRLERSDMPELFRHAAALVSASEFEGFGIPIIEAMAVGCPVAASPAEAVVEVLGGCGWIATDFSSNELATVTRRALVARTSDKDDTLLRARQRATALYTWEGAARTLERVLTGSMAC
jgi:glycosyltransferase involved in cell wall biosynthesis